MIDFITDAIRDHLNYTTSKYEMRTDPMYEEFLKYVEEEMKYFRFFTPIENGKFGQYRVVKKNGVLEEIFVPYANQKKYQHKYDNAKKHYIQCLKTRFENKNKVLLTSEKKMVYVPSGDGLGPVCEL